MFFEKNVSCQNVKNVNCRPTLKKMLCNLNKPNVNHHTKIVGYYRLSFLFLGNFLNNNSK